MKKNKIFCSESILFSKLGHSTQNVFLYLYFKVYWYICSPHDKKNAASLNKI